MKKDDFSLAESRQCVELLATDYTYVILFNNPPVFGMCKKEEKNLKITRQLDILIRLARYYIYTV